MLQKPIHLLFCALFTCVAGLRGELCAQALLPQILLVNGCLQHPNPNGSPVPVESELIVLKNGATPISVNSLGFDLPFNGFGNSNADVGVGPSGTSYACGFKQPTVTMLSSCANVIPLGPNDQIPPGALVVFITTGTTTSVDLDGTDFADLCISGQTIYILQNACERTAAAFANGPPAGGGDPFRSVVVTGAGPTQTITYDTRLIGGTDGSYYSVPDSTYGNQNCRLPPLFQGNCSTTIDTLRLFLCSGEALEIMETGQIFNERQPAGDVRIPLSSGCDSMLYVDLTFPEPTLGSQGGMYCPGDTVFIGIDTFTLARQNGIATIPNAASTGCDSLVDVNLQYTPIGELRVVGDFSICPGDSVELRFDYDNQGAVNATLEDAQGNRFDLNNLRNFDRRKVFPGESTAYRIVAAERLGCPVPFTGISRVTVSDLSVQSRVVTDPADFCVDTLGLGVVTVSGGVAPYSIEWSNGSRTEANPNLLPGEYSVMVTDAAACSLVETITISDNNPLRVEIEVAQSACTGSRPVLEVVASSGGVGELYVSLDQALYLPISRLPDIPPAVPTNSSGSIIQRVFVRDQSGCEISVPVLIPGPLQRTLFLPQRLTILNGDSLLLEPVTDLPPATIAWSPRTGLANPDSLSTIASPSTSTVYTLTLTSAEGCIYTASTQVIVDQNTEVYLPTAFSPNGDRINDEYVIGTGAQVEEVITLEIYDRWGNQLHAGPEPWDGIFNGRPVNSGIYVVRSEVLLRNGQTVVDHGTVLLRR